MAKPLKSQHSSQHKPSAGTMNHKVPAGIIERNLLGTNPRTEQFEPTPGDPVRQHHKMAGGC